MGLNTYEPLSYLTTYKGLNGSVLGDIMVATKSISVYNSIRKVPLLNHFLNINQGVFTLYEVDVELYIKHEHVEVEPITITLGNESITMDGVQAYIYTEISKTTSEKKLAKLKLALFKHKRKGNEMLEERYQNYNSLKKLRLGDVKLSDMSDDEYEMIADIKLLKHFRKINRGYFIIKGVSVSIECEYDESDIDSTTISVDGVDVELSGFQALVNSTIATNSNSKQYEKFMKKISKADKCIAENPDEISVPQVNPNEGLDLSTIDYDTFKELTLADIIVFNQGDEFYDIKDEKLHLQFFSTDTGPFSLEDYLLSTETEYHVNEMEFDFTVYIDGVYLKLSEVQCQILNALTLNTTVDVIRRMLQVAYNYTHNDEPLKSLRLEVTTR